MKVNDKQFLKGKGRLWRAQPEPHSYLYSQQPVKLIAMLLGWNQGQSWGFKIRTMLIPGTPTWLFIWPRSLHRVSLQEVRFWMNKWRLEHRNSATHIPHDLKYVHLVTYKHRKFSQLLQKVVPQATTLSAPTSRAEGLGLPLLGSPQLKKFF